MIKIVQRGFMRFINTFFYGPKVYNYIYYKINNRECLRMTSWISIKRDSVRGLMLKKREERNRPERPKWFLKKHKLSEVSKPRSSIRRDSNKKYRWRRPLSNTKKRMRKERPNPYRMVPFLLIWWTENSKRTPKFSPIWLNKREKKKLVNGMFPLKKLNQWPKLKCLRLFDQEKERENVGKEESIKFVLSVKTSLVNLQNTRDLLDQWV